MDFVAPKTPWELAGYRRAVERECFVREASYQDVTETVAGFELRQMRLRDYLALRAMAHPLLIGGEITPAQLLAFFWLLSPEYNPQSVAGRQAFYKGSGLIPPRRPLVHWPWLMRIWKRRTQKVLARVEQALIGARAYIDEALQDYPGTQLQGREVSYWGEGAAICAGLARVYSWSEAEILELPMKRVLQYLKEIVGQERGPAALSNPSDTVKADFLHDWHRATAAARAAGTTATGTNSSNGGSK